MIATHVAPYTLATAIVIVAILHPRTLRSNREHSSQAPTSTLTLLQQPWPVTRIGVVVLTLVKVVGVTILAMSTRGMKEGRA
jgi:hypothetical protein